MKVSIVIPAHNEEACIEKTLQKVLNQDYPDFEVIVVDNNSTDKTSELAQKMGVKVLFEKNKGTQWARERGRLSASGEIIANLDADCLPEKNWLRRGTQHFSDTKVVAVGGPYNYYDGRESFRVFSLIFQKTIYALFNFLMQKFNRGAVLIGGNVFLRADILEKVGGYNTNIVFYGDDTDTAKRMSKQGRVVFDTGLVVKTSARRLKSEGSFKISIIYIYHFFKVLFSSFEK
ncbi:MAG: glycosyltransferase family 2 protein [bacterium]